MPDVSPIQLRNQVFTVVDGLSDFAAGRVTKGDESVINDADWRDNRLPAAVVFIGLCIIGVPSLDDIGGGIGAQLSVVVRVSVPNQESATFGADLDALIANVYAALQPDVAFGVLPVFNKRLRMGEMPTFQVAQGPTGGIDQWFIVECVSL